MSSGTLLQFYNNPRGCPRLQGCDEYEGDCPTRPLEITGYALYPRRSSRDKNLPEKVMQFGPNYLVQIDKTSAQSRMDDTHISADSALRSMRPGDKARNLDIILQVFKNCRNLASVADCQCSSAYQMVPCLEQDDTFWASTRIIRYRGSVPVIVEIIASPAFEAVMNDIWELADERLGSFELLFKPPEKGARAVVFRSDKPQESDWNAHDKGGYLLGYPVLRHEIHDILCRNDHARRRETLSIDLLDSELCLSCAARTVGIPKSAFVRARHEKALRHKDSRILDNITGCMMLYPGTGAADNSHFLARVTTENPWRTAVDTLIEARPNENEQIPRLYFLCDPDFRLWSHELCSFNEGYLEVEGYEERSCAVKIMQDDFNAFSWEIEVYQELEGEPFILELYAAFCCFRYSLPYGVVVTELYDRGLKSFDGMELRYRRAIFTCIKRLHQLGYHYTYLGASPFGLRQDGSVALLDLSQVKRYSDSYGDSYSYENRERALQTSQTVSQGAQYTNTNPITGLVENELWILGGLRLGNDSSFFEATVFDSEHQCGRPCAIKLFETGNSKNEERLACFKRELEAYEKLKGRAFVPTFFAAYAAALDTGPVGVIVTELTDWVSPVSSYADLNVDQKGAALDCIRQLHRAGYHHMNTEPRKFGKRSNGEVVIMNFAFAEPIDVAFACKHDDLEMCSRILNLKRELFEEDYAETTNRLEKMIKFTSWDNSFNSEEN
ncbi:hypothetical protein AJ79_04912 [Helicocarpus griseus UAMH5409]|uniref:Protein kinase domain-containing protein n=1 Tax=Helicocarpus griseus UAMH5409 TaxID=1447875 RepID=A0A2B7XRM9_9EURO|nr:hypothetical protein AJ79_04912 [Helicocarpus griseus UAMH5409]